MPRAVAFSGALKRKQMKEKRERLQRKKEEQKQQEERVKELLLQGQGQGDSHDTPNNNDPYNGKFVKGLSKPFKSESYGAGRLQENSNHAVGTRLRSVFLKRSAAEIEISRRESMKPLEFLPESDLEVSFESLFPEVIGFPKRPKWDYSTRREDLEKNETKMFENWMDDIYNRYPAEELSYFEHNLEVWRQLWRVLEISDIIMIIVDIRHPVIHFPPSLYHYVVKEMNRKLVVVFNKVDLVAPNTLFAWKQYFKEQFPELHMASFSCYPPDPKLINDSSTAALQYVVRRPKRRYYNAVGVRDVLVACKDVEISKNGAQVDWDDLITHHDGRKKKDNQGSESSDQDGSSNESETEGRDPKGRVDLLGKQKEDDLAETLQTVHIEEDEHMPHKDYVTIGLVGHPNVGKSSLINSIMGRTVVSTSKTPGHTKHFQTIFLTPNVRLCDSPGLVFPSLLPKPLQILSGMYPIAQVQEPYSVVNYLAERVNLPRLLKLEPPPTYGRGPFRWSAFGICESYAFLRGFLTAKTGHPDVYRAANAILQLANDGRILLSFKPPGFFTSTKYEQLRVMAADAAEISSDKGEQTPQQVKIQGREDDSEDEEETESSGDEDEDETNRFQANTRMGGFFGLLQDDDGSNSDEEEEDEDEEDEEEEDDDEK